MLGQHVPSLVLGGMAAQCRATQDGTQQCISACPGLPEIAGRACELCRKLSSTQQFKKSSTSTMTLGPPMMRGSSKTQKTSYAKHSGSRMQATCACVAPTSAQQCKTPHMPR